MYLFNIQFVRQLLQTNLFIAIVGIIGPKLQSRSWFVRQFPINIPVLQFALIDLRLIEYISFQYIYQLRVMSKQYASDACYYYRKLCGKCGET